jgi:hypothetical protein
MTCGNIKTLVTFMKITISKKCTLFRSKFKFVFIIGSKIRPTSTPKDAQKRIITGATKKPFHGSLRLNNVARETINQIDSSVKGFIPVFKRHRCISKKG